MRKYILFVFILTFAFTKAYGQDNNKPPVFKQMSFSTTEGKTFTLAGISGDAEISTGSSNEIQVIIRANENAQKYVDFDFKNDDEGLSLEEKMKDKENSGDHNYTNINIAYEIKLPASYSVKIATASGDMSITGLNGKINVSTASGDVALNNVSGDTKIATASGDVSLRGNNGKINVSTASGDVSVNYSGKNYGTSIASASGDINFTYSGDFAADVSISTVNGDVSVPSRYENESAKKNKVYKMSVNGGGENVKISTATGDISVSEK